MKKLTLAILLAIGSAQAANYQNIVMTQIDSTGEQVTLATLQVDVEHHIVVSVEYINGTHGDLDGVEQLDIPERLWLDPASYEGSKCPAVETPDGWMFGDYCPDED